MGPPGGWEPPAPPSPAEEALLPPLQAVGKTSRRGGLLPLTPQLSPILHPQAWLPHPSPISLNHHPCPDLLASSSLPAPTCPVPGIFLKHRSDHRALSSAPFLGSLSPWAWHQPPPQPTNPASSPSDPLPLLPLTAASFHTSSPLLCCACQAGPPLCLVGTTLLSEAQLQEAPSFELG